VCEATREKKKKEEAAGKEISPNEDARWTRKELLETSQSDARYSTAFQAACRRAFRNVSIISSHVSREGEKKCCARQTWNCLGQFTQDDPKRRRDVTSCHQFVPVTRAVSDRCCRSVASHSEYINAYVYACACARAISFSLRYFRSVRRISTFLTRGWDHIEHLLRFHMRIHFARSFNILLFV